MDLKELETFIKVAELRSFSKTAVSLSVTQPTITNHIQSLERELDTRLINRKGRNVSLTESGKVLYRYAMDILNSCNMAKLELNSDMDNLNGHLTIQASAVPRKHLVPKLISDFIGQHPNVTFTINESEDRDSLTDINNRQLDFAILDFKTEDSTIDFVKVMEEELLLVVPNSLPYNNYDTVSSKDILLNNKLILKENTQDAKFLLAKDLGSIDLSIDDVDIAGYSKDLETIKKLVELGKGVAFLTLTDIKDGLNEGKFKALALKEGNIVKEYYLASPNNRYLSPVSEMFKLYMEDYLNDRI